MQEIRNQLNLKVVAEKANFGKLLNLDISQTKAMN